MKQRVMIIILIMSVFILGVLFASAVRHRQESNAQSESAAAETSDEDAQKAEEAGEVTGADLMPVDEPEAEDSRLFFLSFHLSPFTFNLSWLPLVSCGSWRYTSRW